MSTVDWNRGVIESKTTLQEAQMFQLSNEAVAKRQRTDEESEEEIARECLSLFANLCYLKTEYAHLTRTNQLLSLLGAF